jgi:hypothetical protein
LIRKKGIEYRFENPDFPPADAEGDSRASQLCRNRAFKPETCAKEYEASYVILFPDFE